MARPKKQSTILIVNPLPGRSAYTSRQKAHKLRDKGVAVFTADGRLRLVDQVWLRSAQAMDHANAEVDAQIRLNRKGVVFWNGNCDPAGHRIPGTVRS